MTDAQKISIESYLNWLLLSADQTEDLMDREEKNGNTEEAEQLNHILNILFARRESAIEILARLGYKTTHNFASNTFTVTEKKN